MARARTHSLARVVYLFVVPCLSCVVFLLCVAAALRGTSFVFVLSRSAGYACFVSPLPPPPSLWVPRGQVEDNRFSISVHYRNCARIDVPKVKDVVVNVQAKHERIRMGSGKEVRLEQGSGEAVDNQGRTGVGIGTKMTREQSI